ncbi:MAG: group II intron reverse transcriptase/maturase [Acidobacteria bacterium]|nr:MAG: group II intron reverse transcriptase/maturase [Acidobacteriota bacterium]
MRTTDKPFSIDKKRVYEAYKAVKSNAGAAGVDGQTIEQFEADLQGNLYKLWNRMSSGSYFPPPVRAVSIPKKSGGQRILGVPTVADRVAQMVIKQLIEPDLEPIFLADSYGYRPRKSALDAVGVTRQRCWKYDWVLEFDIKGLFDNIDHELLLRAVRKHVTCKWALLYIERWLTAPMEQDDGTQIARTCGTPQGGFSPILSKALKAELQARLTECRLELHPTKTKIVYCRDAKRRGKYPNVTFDFLGYCFRPRLVQNSRYTLFCGFTPAVSVSAMTAMRTTIRELGLRHRTELSMADIARQINPLLRGWIAYYGRYTPSALNPMLRYVNLTLRAWVMRKFKRFAAKTIRAGRFLERTAREHTDMFVHWRLGLTGVFA